MKDKVLVIGRNFHPDGKETAALIADALRPYTEQEGVGIDLVLFKDIVFDISNDEVIILSSATGKHLHEYSAVLMTNWFSHASVRKDMALALALYFDKHGIPLFNSEALYNRSSSKLSQMMVAAYNDIPIARTIFSLTLDHTVAYMRQIDFTGPFIFKDAQASRGKGNYLLKDVSEISQHADEHSERSPFMAQQFIESDGSDYRFFVAGGKTQVVIKRTGSTDSHLNNTSAGSASEVVATDSFSEEVLAAVRRISMLLHREVTGVDIMFDKNNAQAYFLEANPIPQIATGSNTALKLEALAGALVAAAKGGSV